MADDELQRLLAFAETDDVFSNGAQLGRMYGTAYAALQTLMSQHGLSTVDGQCQGLIKVRAFNFTLKVNLNCYPLSSVSTSEFSLSHSNLPSRGL